MDCGCYRNGENYVVRIRGSEYTLNPYDWGEFMEALIDVDQGATEHMSEDYNNLPEPCAPSGKGLSLSSLLGLVPRTLGITRRV